MTWPRRVRTGEVVLKVVFGVCVMVATGIFAAISIVSGIEPEPVVGFCESTNECTEEFMSEEEEVVVIEPKQECNGVIYLTFDDGPGDYTEWLLDILKKYGVKATFFVTSRGDDATILREYQEGHAVGLHTWSHNYSYIYDNADNYFADLEQIRARVRTITGEDPKLLRFPGGSSNTVSRRYDHRTRIMSYLAGAVESWGLTYFDWNVDSDDAGAAKDPETVYNNVISRLKAGEESVVLQHDIKGYSVEAVESIIIYGLENGYEFKKLDTASFNAHHGINN